MQPIRRDWIVIFALFAAVVVAFQFFDSNKLGD